MSGLGSGGPDDNDAQAGRLVVEDTAATVCSHPRPGSNSDGNIVAFHATQDPISGPVSPALGSEESGAVGDSNGAAVRRLTPRECERLQAFPDDWTLVPDSAPDSRRYAGLGDAVTVSVAELIGSRLR